MQIVDKKVTELKAYDKNPRKNNNAVEPVAESIKQFGFKVPIIIDKDNVIVAGHTRLRAANKLGMKTVPCIVADDLTPEQIKAFRLADNKVSEFAEWDMDLLTSELKEIDFDMDLFGFDYKDELQDGVIEDDYDINLNEESKSKIGDIYLLGNHRLMCGDSTKEADVKKLMGGELADLLITDPPYNVDYEGVAGKIKNDNMPDDKFRAFLTDAFKNAFIFMKQGAPFYIWHADTEGYNFRGACFDSGLKIRQCLIWVKNSLVLGRQDYQWKHEPCLYGESEIIETEHEPCLYGWTGGKAHYFFKNRRQTTILEFSKPKRSAEHPTMKPILLFDYHMQCSSKEEDIVLDLFGGSGTCIMAAEQNGRRCFTMEYDPKYVDVIIDRWEKFTQKKAVLLR